MPHRTKCTQKAIEKALRLARGGVSLAAKRLGVTERTLRNYLDRWPELREVLAEERGRIIDQAEYKMASAINKGEAWAITLCLKTIGKDRGYTERNEHDLSGGQIDALIAEFMATLDPRRQNAAGGAPAAPQAPGGGNRAGAG